MFCVSDRFATLSHVECSVGVWGDGVGGGFGGRVGDNHVRDPLIMINGDAAMFLRQSDCLATHSQ